MIRIKLVVRKGSGNYRAFSFYYGGSMYSAIELRNLARKPKKEDDIYVKNQEVISVKVKQRLILQGKMKQ